MHHLLKPNGDLISFSDEGDCLDYKLRSGEDLTLVNESEVTSVWDPILEYHYFQYTGNRLTLWGRFKNWLGI